MIHYKLSQLFFYNSPWRMPWRGDTMGRDKMEEIDIFISNLQQGKQFLTATELQTVKMRYPAEYESYMKKKEYKIDGEKYYFIEL